MLGPPARFVGRGGEKLDAALTAFAARRRPAGAASTPARRRAASPTACCSAGAAQVVAVDVGHGQLHPALRDDPRVVVRERCNVRHLTRRDIGGPVDLVVADLSFISLAHGAPGARSVCCRPGADLVLLVKPQFEAGRAEVVAGPGVVRDPAVRDAVRRRIDDALRAAGATIMGWMESPLRGADGNVELFVAHAPGADGRQPGGRRVDASGA